MSRLNPSAPPARLESFDALRGICAILVVLMHSRFLSQYDPFPSAYLVVDLFFAMSGFVIGHAYDRRLRAGGYVRTFVARRFVRLAPMWLVGLGLGSAQAMLLALRSGGVIEAGTTAALAILFVPSPFSPYLFPYNSPGWSLFFECVANLVYGMLARLLDIAVLAAIVGLSALALVWRALAHGNLDGGAVWATFDIGLARVTFSFFFGLLVYRLPRPTPFAGGGRFIFWAAMVGVVLLARANPPLPWRGMFDLLFVLAAMPATIWCALKASFGNSRWANALGVLSYPLYTFHFPVMMVAYLCRGYLTGFPVSAMPPSIVIAIVIGILATAYALGVWLDPRAQALAGRYLGRPVRPGLAGAPENR